MITLVTLGAKRRVAARLTASEEAHELAQQAEEYVLPDLAGCALVRELHVYGKLVPTEAASADRSADPAQHGGLGTLLMLEAERIAREAGYVLT